MQSIDRARQAPNDTTGWWIKTPTGWPEVPSSEVAFSPFETYPTRDHGAMREKLRDRKYYGHLFIYGGDMFSKLITIEFRHLNRWLSNLFYEPRTLQVIEPSEPGFPIGLEFHVAWGGDGFSIFYNQDDYDDIMKVLRSHRVEGVPPRPKTVDERLREKTGSGLHLTHVGGVPVCECHKDLPPKERND